MTVELSFIKRIRARVEITPEILLALGNSWSQVFIFEPKFILSPGGWMKVFFVTEA